MLLEEFRLHIDVFTPETISMARLVEYLRELAVLLGEEKHVHLFRVEESGSLDVVGAVESSAAGTVENRVHEARRGQGPPEPLRAIRNINRKLQEDRGTASLVRGPAEIIRFPGRELLQGAIFKATQEDSLDGVVIKVGGKKEMVPVHLQTGDEIHVCLANRALARELAKDIFVTEVRVHGEARWLRDSMGEWRLERFFIRHFDPLNPEPLSAVVAKLRAVTGSEWSEIEDPWKELKDIRDGD